VAGHDPCLTSNDHQNVPIAEHEDEDFDDNERDEVPDSVSNCGHATLPEHKPVADSVSHGACRKAQRHAVHDRVFKLRQVEIRVEFRVTRISTR